MSNIGTVDVESQSAGAGSTFWCSIKNEKQTFVCRHPTVQPSPYNTTIKINKIFGLYPVRRKLLVESAGREIEKIKTQLQIRLLGYPEIALQFVSGPSDTLLCSYAATQSINQRVAQVYGPATAQTLDFVSVDYGSYSLCGSISRAPILARIQHIFVNGRLQDEIELLDVVRSALCTNEYMAKTNVAARSNEPHIRLSRAKHPMFVLLIRSENTNAFSAVTGSDSTSGVSDDASDIKRLLVLACIKFLRKFGMASDSHMQKLTSQPDTLSMPSQQSNAYCSSHSRKRRGSPSHEMRKQHIHVANNRFPILFGSGQSDCGSTQNQFSTDKPTAREAPIPSLCVDLRSMMALTGQHEVDLPVNINSLQVIGQADGKYIMCRCDPWLVAIDQHAADERIRLEAFFDELCEMFLLIAQLPPNCPVSAVIGVSVLMPSVSVVLSEHDGGVIRSMGAEFRLLGIQFASRESPGIHQEEEGSCTIHIVCAPTVLVPRLASNSRSRGGADEGFGKMLLLSAANWIADHPKALGTQRDHTRFADSSCSTSSADLARAWPVLASWPPILVETARSVACSSAIKFNQALSKDKCQLIVDRLAQCKFPGFCAHGRRSVARVARLEMTG
ncbi:DNA mismatch repair protein [Coemansia sp. RSA 1365]|nr:DNA mismatch repair protein [Coemansia sp. RSA 1365]